MIRKTRRDVRQAVDDLKIDEDPELDVTIHREHIMTRSRAEREGREILGVADTPGDTDHVRVEVDR